MMAVIRLRGEGSLDQGGGDEERSPIQNMWYLGWCGREKVPPDWRWVVGERERVTLRVWPKQQQLTHLMLGSFYAQPHFISCKDRRPQLQHCHFTKYR